MILTRQSNMNEDGQPNIVKCRYCHQVRIYWAKNERWPYVFNPNLGPGVKPEHHKCPEWKKFHPESPEWSKSNNQVPKYHQNNEKPNTDPKQTTFTSSSSNNADLIPLIREELLLLQGIGAQLKNIGDSLDLISRYTKTTSQSVNTMLEDAKEFKFEKGVSDVKHDSVLDENDDIYDEVSDTDDNTREQ